MRPYPFLPTLHGNGIRHVGIYHGCGLRLFLAVALRGGRRPERLFSHDGLGNGDNRRLFQRYGAQPRLPAPGSTEGTTFSAANEPLIPTGWAATSYLPTYFSRAWAANGKSRYSRTGNFPAKWRKWILPSATSGSGVPHRGKKFPEEERERTVPPPVQLQTEKPRRQGSRPCDRPLRQHLHPGSDNPGRGLRRRHRRIPAMPGGLKTH